PTQPPPPLPTTTTTTTVNPNSQTVPPDAQAQINAVKRTPPNSTAALIQALGALEDFGLTPQEAINVGFGHFPVAGLANWSDDWLMPRFTPSFHLHQGNDIFAAGDVGDQGMFSAPGRPPAGPLLWASSVNPAGGTLRLAQAEVVQAAGEMDWDRLLAREEEKTL